MTRSDHSTHDTQDNTNIYHNNNNNNNNNNNMNNIHHSNTNSNSNSNTSINSHHHHISPITQHGLSRSDLVRIIAQGLHALDLPQSAATVVQESGIPVHHPEADQFRESVLRGEWSTATELVPHLGLQHSDTRRRVLFLIHRQQFLEQVEAGDTTAALSTLRTCLAPESPGPEHLHRLSALVMLRDPVQLRSKAHWDGAAGKSRRRLLMALQRCIPPSVLLPEDRLERLLRRAVGSRPPSTSLSGHPSPRHPTSGISLLREDPDPASLVPRRCLHVLSGHHDEVWFVAFSPDGKVLASASKDATIILHEVQSLTNGDRSYRPVVCRGHAASVTYLAFSPDSTRLLSVSSDRSLRLWTVPDGRWIRTYASHGTPVSSVLWLDDHTFISSGEREDRTIRRWDADTGDELSCVTLDHRIQDMALGYGSSQARRRKGRRRGRQTMTEGRGANDEEYGDGDNDNDNDNEDDHDHDGIDIDDVERDHDPHYYDDDGNTDPLEQHQYQYQQRSHFERRLVVAGPSENALYIYDPYNVAPSRRHTLPESKGVTSLAVSPDGRFLLVNLSCSPQGAGTSCIRLWDLEEQRVVREYVGQQQDRFIVRSTFGAGAQLVVSGSEDCSVHVWETRTGTLMARLPGHTDAITAVAHNPSSATMYASASDDGTVRIWGTDAASLMEGASVSLISGPST